MNTSIEIIAVGIVGVLLLFYCHMFAMHWEHVKDSQEIPVEKKSHYFLLFLLVFTFIMLAMVAFAVFCMRTEKSNLILLAGNGTLFALGCRIFGKLRARVELAELKAFDVA